MKTKPWKEIKDAGLSAEAQAEVGEQVQRTLLAMDLAELRKRIGGMTQTQVGELLGVSQAAISQVERREDALFSNLAEYVKALGGELELVAHFKDGEDVRITQFDQVKEQIEEAVGKEG